MEVSLATPEGIVFSGNTDDLLLQANAGQINILTGHSNIVTTVEEGPVVIKTSEGNKEFQVGKGVLKVEDDKISILVDRVQD